MAYPSTKNKYTEVITALGGLDMVDSDDNIKYRSPYAKNFRINQPNEAGRHVAITTRKGAGYYTKPVQESLLAAFTGSLAASSAKVGTDTNIQLQRFTGAVNGLLTRIRVWAKLGTATSVVRVDVYDDNGNRPGRKIAQSSLGDLDRNFKAVDARFIQAPELIENQQYWMVFYVQDDGQGEAELQTRKGGASAYTSNAGVAGGQEQDFTICHEVYVSPKLPCKGAYRFNRDDGENKTIAAYGTTMYYIDGDTFKPLVEGLSPLAQEYSFANGDGKVFWCNGYDQLTTWDGSTEHRNLVENSNFTNGTLGWTGISSTLSTDTDSHSAPNSLKVVGTGAQVNISLEYNLRYKVSLWVKGQATKLWLTVNGSNDKLPGTEQGVNGVWTQKEFYFTAPADASTLQFRTNGNFFLDDVIVEYTGIEYIVDPQLPKLSMICFHKDRLFGVSAEDKNRLVFSENPGNPSDKPKREQWYYQWLSVSFIYIPRPKNGSPVTGIVPFQDNLIIFTQDRKYVLSGSDRGNFYLRESTGSGGALSSRGITNDNNYIYFTSHDGIYRFNGSKDEKVSALVQPLFDECPQKHEITLALWKSDLYAFFASRNASHQDQTLILLGDLSEWCLDTETHIGRAIYYSDADDNMELVLFGSAAPIAYYAEKDFNDLGAPIDFDYRLKYDSRSVPGQRKKYKRYVPLVKAVGKTFPVTYGTDRDFEDSPHLKRASLVVGGARIGSFLIDGSTKLTGATAFKPKKTPVSGYSRYMQFRVMRNAVDNEVNFMGVQFLYKIKKL